MLFLKSIDENQALSQYIHAVMQRVFNFILESAKAHQALQTMVASDAFVALKTQVNEITPENASINGVTPLFLTAITLLSGIKQPNKWLVALSQKSPSKNSLTATIYELTNTLNLVQDRCRDAHRAVCQGLAGTLAEQARLVEAERLEEEERRAEAKRHAELERRAEAERHAEAERREADEKKQRIAARHLTAAKRAAAAKQCAEDVRLAHLEIVHKAQAPVVREILRQCHAYLLAKIKKNPEAAGEIDNPEYQDFLNSLDDPQATVWDMIDRLKVIYQKLKQTDSADRLSSHNATLAQIIKPFFDEARRTIAPFSVLTTQETAFTTVLSYLDNPSIKSLQCAHPTFRDEIKPAMRRIANDNKALAKRLRTPMSDYQSSPSSTRVTGPQIDYDNLLSWKDGCFVAALQDHSLGFWSIRRASSDAIVEVELFARFPGHAGGLSCIVAVSDELFATGSWEDDSIKIWNGSGCIRTLTDHEASVNCIVALSGNRIASGSRDGTIRIWDVETGDCLHVLTGHPGSVAKLVVLQNGNIASACHSTSSGNNRPEAISDNIIRIWDTETGDCLHELNQHGVSNDYLMVLKNGVLVSGSDSSSSGLYMWDAVKGDCISVYPDDLDGWHKFCDEYNNLTLLADNQVIFKSGDRDLVLLDASDCNGGWIAPRSYQSTPSDQDVIVGPVLLSCGLVACASRESYTDLDDNRAQHYICISDPKAGRFLGQYPLPDNFGYVECMTVLSNGDLLVASRERTELFAFPKLVYDEAPLIQPEPEREAPRPF